MNNQFGIYGFNAFHGPIRRNDRGIIIPDSWDALCARALELLGMTTARTWPAPVTAYVSDDRWVADCPHDNGGIGVSPDNPYGMDMGCGTMIRIIMPDGWQEAERILDARPPRARHWFPQRGETLRSLREENLRRGDPLERS